MRDPVPAPTSPDWLTVASIALIAYALSNLVHEGLGHGGVCLLVGCSPHLLTSMQFDGDSTGLSGTAVRLIAAGGSLANLLAAALAIFLMRLTRRNGGPTWFFLWLLATVSLLQATGYLLFSGLGRVGDWAEVIQGWPFTGFWRVGLATVGGVAYWLATSWAMRNLAARLHSRTPARVTEAYRYTLVAYLTGAALYLAAGLRDPGGLAILLISAVAASLGGTSGLAWGPQLLKDPTLHPSAIDLSPLVLGRDWRWVTAAGLTGAGFVLLLGPGIRL